MDKIELPVKLVQEVLSDLRTLAVENIELNGQILAVGRILASAKHHLPPPMEEERRPASIAVLQRELEKSLKTSAIEDKSTRKQIGA